MPEGAFDGAAREALAKGIDGAAKAIEGFGDDPRQEFLAWVIVEEVKLGYLFAGGVDPLSRVIPAVVFFYAPPGVIYAERREEAVRLVHDALVAANPGSDYRAVATSVMIWDVADGTWGPTGKLWHLPDFASAAGYKRLHDLATS